MPLGESLIFYLAFKFVNLDFGYVFFVPEMSAIFTLLLLRLSKLLWSGCFNQCILNCFLWSKFIKFIHQAMVYGVSVRIDRPRLSLVEVWIFCLMFSQNKFMSSLSFKFSKAANLLEIFM
jgi:hypothetical protein